MAEMILPGVYIEVRPEGLITPGLISIGNLGVVGTASKGPIDTPVVLGSYLEAREKFGEYDAWNGGNTDELTLVRALEIAYAHGATTVFAMRVAGKSGDPAVTTALKASAVLKSGADNCVTLTAKSEGTWANGLSVSVVAAEENAFVENEVIPLPNPKLSHKPVQSARNRLKVNGRVVEIVYGEDAAAPTSGQVKVKLSDGTLTFATGEVVDGDQVRVSYMAAASEAVKVTL
ncbi:MAG TPA: hypothetical protein V6C57_08960, partial [Coleofasciculaceae cyanobacterium]